MDMKRYDRLRQGQAAKLTTNNGRTTADARTHQPLAKPVLVTSAETLKPGMTLRLHSQGLVGLVQILKCYPENYKSLDLSEWTCWLEGLTNHGWTGLYGLSHLKKFKAEIVQEA